MAAPVGRRGSLTPGIPSLSPLRKVRRPSLRGHVVEPVDSIVSVCYDEAKGTQEHLSVAATDITGVAEALLKEFDCTLKPSCLRMECRDIEEVEGEWQPLTTVADLSGSAVRLVYALGDAPIVAGTLRCSLCDAHEARIACAACELPFCVACDHRTHLQAGAESMRNHPRKALHTDDTIVMPMPEVPLVPDEASRQLAVLTAYYKKVNPKKGPAGVRAIYDDRRKEDDFVPPAAWALLCGQLQGKYGADGTLGAEVEAEAVNAMASELIAKGHSNNIDGCIASFRAAGYPPQEWTPVLSSMQQPEFDELMVALTHQKQKQAAEVAETTAVAAETTPLPSSAAVADGEARCGAVGLWRARVPRGEGEARSDFLLHVERFDGAGNSRPGRIGLRGHGQQRGVSGVTAETWSCEIVSGWWDQAAAQDETCQPQQQVSLTLCFADGCGPPTSCLPFCSGLPAHICECWVCCLQ